MLCIYDSVGRDDMLYWLPDTNSQLSQSLQSGCHARLYASCHYNSGSLYRHCLFATVVVCIAHCCLTLLLSVADRMMAYRLSAPSPYRCSAHCIGVPFYSSPAREGWTWSIYTSAWWTGTSTPQVSAKWGIPRPDWAIKVSGLK